MPRFLVIGSDETLLGLFSGMASDLGHPSVCEVLQNVTPEDVEACEYVVFLPAAQPKPKAARGKKNTNARPEQQEVVFKRQAGGFQAITSPIPPVLALPQPTEGKAV